jgi:DNA-binding transcriptional regulator YiaG
VRQALISSHCGSSRTAAARLFAAYLNVGKSTVAAWEQGTKRPSGPAAKLLELVERLGCAGVAL